MKMKWEVDEATVVEIKMGIFGSKRIMVNGQPIDIDPGERKKPETRFALPDGRPAAIRIDKHWVGYPDIELRVDGRMMVASTKAPISCSSCSAAAKPYDRFCGACGQTMPSAESYLHKKHVNNATTTIRALAVLFILSGVLMFFLTQAQSEEALAQLQNMDPQSLFPEPIDGEMYTVSELRSQILWESWGVLIVNLIIATAMGILSFWGKRAPLAAVLVATATYVVVLVTNAILDPATIANAIFIKIIVIAFLVRGIKSALALRSLNV